ncbi:MAG: protein kinase domain-containing protein [Candidatus Rokuibacteriota bacterium]
MSQKIGKYEILERIGRGGMGTVFKAHDPMLERLVALKVISEVDVSDELKARFYREAQAGAKLNHPNVITVHDLGEDADRLFIVMEFLDGEELKSIIASRKDLSLEEKLALMIQVCDGLHYAHQKGVIHRDIKPGNIFVLRNGQAKILDFGIARIATAQDGLTRTGLIMGTLRYMSPEQARGRVDHRSDIFSVGAVFYELLAYRAAFDRENPIEILEQIRSEEPPLLTEVDPAVPPELSAIIEQALQKNPAQRFQDLGQMRTRLEAIHRKAARERERLQAQVRVKMDQVRELQAALAAQLGTPHDAETLAILDDRVRPAQLLALDHELAGRIEHLRTRLARVEAMRPILARGLELMQEGQLEAAITALEQVLRELPQHPHALDAFRQARTLKDAQGARQQEAERLLQEAASAHAQREYGRCLTLLRQVALVSPAVAEAGPAQELRRSAEAAEAEEAERREARRQEQASAQEALGRMEGARAVADQIQAARHAPDLWRAAEARVAEGRAALVREAYAEARARFAEAGEVYQGAAAAAREAVQATERARVQAERARDEMGRAREAAEAVTSARDAATIWVAAQTSEERGRKALDRVDFTTATEAFRAAAQQYRDAADAAAMAAREREARSRRAIDEARAAVETALAGTDPALAEAALERLLTEAPGHSEVGSLRARVAAHRKRLVEAALADARRLIADDRLEQVSDALARLTALAPEHPEIRALESQAQRAVAKRETRARVRRLLEQARRLAVSGDVEDALALASEAVTLAPDDTRAVRLRDDLEERVRQAQRPAAPVSSPEQPLTVVSEPVVAPVDAPARPTPVEVRQAPPLEPVRRPEVPRPLPTALRTWTLGRQRAAAAGVLVAVAIVVGYALWPSKTPGPSPADQQARAAALREQVAAARDDAARADAEKWVPQLWTASGAKQRAGDTALAEKSFALAIAAYGEAEQAYKQSAAEARRLAGRELRLAEIQRLQDQMGKARREAELAEAAGLAPPQWALATGAQRSAEDSLKQEDWDKATGFLRDAEKGYREAKSESEKKRVVDQNLKRELGLAEELRAKMTDARKRAEQADAKRVAAKLWDDASAKDDAGQKALEARDYAAAQRRFREAREEYERARQQAVAALTQEQKRLAEELRDKMVETRAQAEKAEAQGLAPQLWAAAATKDTEARNLLAKADYSTAQARFREAQHEYERARQQAQVKGQERAEADRAKTRMQSEKQKARQDAPEFRTGIAEEQRGNAAYQTLAFKEATGHYGTAQGLFAKAIATPPAPPPRPDPQAEIRAVLGAFKQAIEGRDVALYLKVRPGLTETERRSLERSFKDTRSHTMELTVNSIDVTGDAAEAKARQKGEAVSIDGDRKPYDTPVTFKLRRTPAGWIIDQFKAGG